MKPKKIDPFMNGFTGKTGSSAAGGARAGGSIKLTKKLTKKPIGGNANMTPLVKPINGGTRVKDTVTSTFKPTKMKDTVTSTFKPTAGTYGATKAYKVRKKK